MSKTHVDAPRRKRSIFAILVRKLRTRMRLAPAPRFKINDHIARDIGLSPAEHERLTYEWPSARIRHPRL
ncbi:MAG: hypothetical protein AAF754_04980 [Pseudomonadota bacterium]